ncbi:MAG: phosphopantetheine-binding protein [Paracoccaceae bacterium]|jgi:acyl carrier protein|nr:phosphopantetheine-binding protein [Paracoccaceae bacterium]MDG1737433.1 phosphopantetheine-binding protein [Paracoccaceae bacterium]MDG2257896.1 phosphopantetheine-binding protein [Paracoccaceae bacterium]
MKRAEIEMVVRSSLEQLTELDLSEIASDADLGDAIGLDSLGKLELLTEVEDRFDMTFYDADTEGASSINGMIEMVLTEVNRADEAA